MPHSTSRAGEIDDPSVGRERRMYNRSAFALWFSVRLETVFDDR
jgi:hypothetical protein